MQQLLLPTQLPLIGCTEAAAAYRAHNHDLQVGGDWYDLVDRPADQRVVAIIGDVVGHGVTQIGVMGQLRAAANALARVCPEPEDIVAGVDEFARVLPGARGTTMAVVMLDGSTTARICSAGHPPVLRVSPGGGVEVIEAGRRPPLTVRAAGAAATFTYAVGDVLILFTDGLVERRGVDLDARFEALGRFVQGLVHRPCDEIADRVLHDFGADADDDVALIVLRPRNHRESGYQLGDMTRPQVQLA